MAVGTLAVLSMTAATIVLYASSNARNAEYSADSTGSSAIAEAGINEALAVLSKASRTAVPGGANDRFDSDLLPQTTTTYEGGTATWSGTLAASGTWTITSTGAVKNPTGAASDIKRTVTAKVPLGRILFDSGKDGDSELYTMNSEGSDERKLTDNTAIDEDALPSPDGQKIVLESNPEPAGNLDIYTMNADGTGTARLTTHAGNDGNPQWTRDGKILFDSARESVQYRVNVGGPAMASGTAGAPSWSADTAGEPSPYLISGGTITSTTATIDMTHPSLPAGTPMALFQAARESFDFEPTGTEG